LSNSASNLRHIPEPRDPAATRAAILDAAERLFCQSGFAGTSLRDIALQAGVNQSLIHHHFGNKQQLWRTTALRYAERVLERQASVLGAGQLDEQTLPRALELDFRFWQAQPDLLRLEMWAALEGNNPFEEAHDTLYRPFVQIVSALQEGGLVRRDINPFHLVVLAAGAVSFWFQNRTELCKALGYQDPNDPTVDERYLSDVLNILFGGGATTSPPQT
jgi:TetR/AcrR family transcriptional regulator